jgi:hypothetical protein
MHIVVPMTQHLAKDVYEVQRALAPLSQRASGLLMMLVSSWTGGISSPRTYEYRIYERVTRRVVFVIGDDELGSDYEAMLQADLDAMTPEQFRLEYRISSVGS